MVDFVDIGIALILLILLTCAVLHNTANRGSKLELLYQELEHQMMCVACREDLALKIEPLINEISSEDKDRCRFARAKLKYILELERLEREESR